MCSIEGCTKNIQARKMCSMHYKRVLRYGDPEAVRFWTPSEEQLLRAKARHKAHKEAIKSLPCSVCGEVNESHGDHQIQDNCDKWKALLIRFKKYGITKDEAFRIMADQWGMCLICETQLTWDYFVIDHNHDTGKVRGFLCNNCNVGIGFFRDRIDLLHSAISYLSIAG